MKNQTKPIHYSGEFTPQGDRSVNPDKYRWVENITPALRFVGRSDEIVRLRHTGYYTNQFQDETVRGEVYQLPARNGKPQYVPAVSDPCNENCAYLDFRSVTTDKEDCARNADSMAECWAESEREYQAKESGRMRIEEIQDEIKTLNRKYRSLCKAIRAEGIKEIAVVKQLIRGQWKETKAGIAKLRTERAKIEADNGYIWE